jgi:hypothetical protein
VSDRQYGCITKLKKEKEKEKQPCIGDNCFQFSDVASLARIP